MNPQTQILIDDEAAGTWSEFVAANVDDFDAPTIAALEISLMATGKAIADMGAGGLFRIKVAT